MEDAIMAIEEEWDGCCSEYPATQIIYDTTEAIERLPIIQPRRGKWIRTGSGSLYDHYECSECGKAPKWDCMGDNRWKIAFTDFCPNCGSDMREVNNETN